MASADHCFLSLSLLLMLTAATTATTAPAAAPHRRLHQTTLPARLDADPSRGPPAPITPESCRRSILASETCDDDIARLVATRQVRAISKACCSVLEKVGDKCVVAAFSSLPFDPTYPRLVKNACGLTA